MLFKSFELIKWVPPPHGYFKINVDGSVEKNGFASCRGVICDSGAPWISDFAHSIDITYLFLSINFMYRYL